MIQRCTECLILINLVYIHFIIFLSIHIILKISIPFKTFLVLPLDFRSFIPILFWGGIAIELEKKKRKKVWKILHWKIIKFTLYFSNPYIFGQIFGLDFDVEKLNQIGEMNLVCQSFIFNIAAQFYKLLFWISKYDQILAKFWISWKLRIIFFVANLCKFVKWLNRFFLQSINYLSINS